MIRRAFQCGAAFFALAALAACSGSTGTLPVSGTVSTGSLVQTDKGLVQGVVQSNVRVWRGIPYAAPPTGANRFAAPQPRAEWTTALDASKPGPVCPQGGAAGQSTTEDCLYLNVYAPTTTANTPVYIFVHGGGFAGGAGSLYDGSQLAQNGIIVVTVNYRLGIFGWLANAALDNGSGNTGDYGLEDQQAALRWVKTNIAAFGGNPNNVTLGGESAGGMSTCLNLASPAVNGLFVRAIVQSGPCAHNWQTLAQNEAAQAGIPAQLGCTGNAAAVAACLRSPSLAISKVLAVQATVPRGTLFPTVGGSDVPNQPRTALGKITLLIGGNTLEAGFNAPPPPSTQAAYEATLAQVYGSQASAVESQYPFSGYAQGQKPLIQAETDWDPQPGAPEITWCYDVRTFGLQSSGNAPTYAYEFNDPNAPSTTGTPEGPIHTSELQYLFPSTTNQPLTGDSKTLSQAMVLYWSHFVATGDPNGGGLPTWPSYRSPTDTMQFIPGRIGAGIDVNAEHKCSFWNGLGGAL